MEYLFVIPKSQQYLLKALLSNCRTLSKIRVWGNPNWVTIFFQTNLDWWMFGANLWHWSHFFTYSYAFLCMLDHQYPWVRARWDKDLPLVWLPQIPSCSSSRSTSDASGCIHNKYNPKKERLYNFWSSNSQNREAFLQTFLASDFSSGKMPFLRNNTIGSI